MAPGSSGIPFHFEFPVEAFFKAGEDGKERRIGGIVSTEHPDRQGEVVLQRGLDFSDFEQNGWFNDNHSRETTGVVGYPMAIRSTTFRGKPATYVEGHLISGHEPADKIWDLANALQKTQRQLGFSVEGKIRRRAGPDGKTIAEAKVSNVAITNCFPGDTVVCGAAEKLTRRLYSGRMVEVRLTTGEKLTGTPNHPIFTNRGWIGLGELNKGCDRVGRFDRDRVAASPVSHDVEYIPARLDEIFDFSLLAGSPLWVGFAGKRQFHGDGSNSDVDVIAIHRFLRRRLEAEFYQKFGKQALTASDKQLTGLLGEGLPTHLGVAGFYASSRDICSSRQFLSLGGCPVPVAPDLFFVPTPGQSRSLGDVVNSDSGDAITGRDRGRALSKSIGFSDIASKHTFDFCGHVFNLDTHHGWYSANGIVAHNCPVNSATGMDLLAKSLMVAESIESTEWEKALTAGNAVAAPATPTPGDGFALRGESLESDAAITTHKKKRKKRRLSKAEAMTQIRARFPALTDPRAIERIWSMAQNKE